MIDKKLNFKSRLLALIKVSKIIIKLYNRVKH